MNNCPVLKYGLQRVIADGTESTGHFRFTVAGGMLTSKIISPRQLLYRGRASELRNSFWNRYWNSGPSTRRAMRAAGEAA